MRHLELRFPPLAVAAVFGLLAYGATWAFPSLGLATRAAPLVVIALFVVGALISFLGVVEFRRAQTTVNPTKPERTSSLVTTGIYRLTRNPMYLGFALGLLGIAAWLSHPVAYLSVGLFVWYMGRFQIEPEERILSGKFGHEFAAYARAVRRWI